MNILGTEYKFNDDVDPNNPKFAGGSGYIELYSKEINIKKIAIEPRTYNKLRFFKEAVIRHEIIHAYFHESGMSDYCEDEKLVEWIAIMSPKMVKTMTDEDVLNDECD